MINTQHQAWPPELSDVLSLGIHAVYTLEVNCEVMETHILSNE